MNVLEVTDYCCTPLHDGAIDEEGARAMAPMLSALGDPVRLRIVSMLLAAPGGSACGCELEGPLGLSQPTVSHHLKILREARLVTGEKRGRWVHYRVVPDRLTEISESLVGSG
ncbi:MAG TPA: metalloregulator ArsR/SmtB family transcription factor [Acidimicrobiia bacterium]|nr:metalloregulator ArsR/SmtB family transcription factor [Acidimicrobiia bacterium]